MYSCGNRGDGRLNFNSGKKLQEIQSRESADDSLVCSWEEVDKRMCDSPKWYPLSASLRFQRWLPNDSQRTVGELCCRSCCFHSNKKKWKWWWNLIEKEGERRRNREEKEEKWYRWIRRDIEIELTLNIMYNKKIHHTIIHTHTCTSYVRQVRLDII